MRNKEKKLLPIIALLLLPILSFSYPIQETRKSSIAFINVAVIDATGSPVQPEMTVVISGNRITNIGKTGKVRIPRNALIINAVGKYLIPGLWDMHVHFWSDEKLLALFVANGVTSVRDMGGDINRVKRWRQEIAAGKLIAPRIVAASGFPLDGAPFELPLLGLKPIVVTNPADSKLAVNNLKKNDADFVKILSTLSRNSYFAIADESRKQRIPFAGHIPETVSASDASDAGQKSIEHLFGIVMACSSSEAELRSARAEALTKQEWGKLLQIENELLDTFDEKKADALFKKFARNKTWQTPTLSMLKRMYLRFETDPAKDPRLQYIPSSLKDNWGNPTEELKKTSPPAVAYFDRTFKRSFDLVRLMHVADVKILPGTDTGDPYTFPGFTLHEELELLVQAGLTPMEALQTATRNPAEYQGLLNSLGTIEKGKTADLILLDANPLEDIRNTRKISAVVFGGKLLSSARLREILLQAESAAAGK
ncbi:MAG: amidohydrolase family protein [Acidobacteriota bacterium]|nr:amidohydrolase family protein [Acidobacteriota bacterium]